MNLRGSCVVFAGACLLLASAIMTPVRAVEARPEAKVVAESLGIHAFGNAQR